MHITHPPQFKTTCYVILFSNCPPPLPPPGFTSAIRELRKLGSARFDRMRRGWISRESQNNQPRAPLFVRTNPSRAPHGSSITWFIGKGLCSINTHRTLFFVRFEQITFARRRILLNNELSLARSSESLN